MGNRKTGVCKWFSARRGYGFITGDDGIDYYVHYTGIDMDGFRVLRQGSVVEFEPAESERGLMATNVTVTEQAAAPAAV